MKIINPLDMAREDAAKKKKKKASSGGSSSGKQTKEVSVSALKQNKGPINPNYRKPSGAQQRQKELTAKWKPKKQQSSAKAKAKAKAKKQQETTRAFQTPKGMEKLVSPALKPQEKTTVRKYYQTTTDQAKKDKAAGKHGLSHADYSLSEENQNAIRRAKDSWQVGQALIQAGEKTRGEQIQKQAHQQAELARAEKGYSGGGDGSGYLPAKLSEEEQRFMAPEAKRTLRMLKRVYDLAKERGDKESMEQARQQGQDLRMSAGAYDVGKIRRWKDQAPTERRTDAHGRPIYTPSQLEAEAQAAFFPAIGNQIKGSLQTFGETAHMATHNAVRNRYNPAYQSNKARRDDLRRKADLERDPAKKAQLQEAAEEAAARAEMEKAKPVLDTFSNGRWALRKAAEQKRTVLNALDNPAEKLLVEAVMGAGEMVPALAASALGGPAAGAAVMGAMSAGAKAGELRNQGRSPEEALARGLVSGAIEGLTEKIPLSNLLKVVKKGGGATMLKNVAKQAGIEATEESASYALNVLADRAAKDPAASFSMEDLLHSAAVGAVSGAGFGAAGSGIGAMNQTASRTPRQPLSAEQNPLLRTVRKEAGKAAAQETAAAARTAPVVPEAGKGTPPAPTRSQGRETAPATLEERKAAHNARVTDWQQRVMEAQEANHQTVFPALSEEGTQLDREEAQLEQETRVAEGQVSRSFQQEENHIDRRDAADVGRQSVKAFQFDHPQLHPFYVEAAQALAEDAEYSLLSQRTSKGQGTVAYRSQALERAEGYGLSRQEVVKVCQDIIDDKGQENYAAAKRVEMVLDDMLSNGYIPNEAMGHPDAKVPPNEAYLQAKEQIPGAVRRDSFEAYLDRSHLALEAGEVTEDQLRQEWEAQQEETTTLPEGMGAMSEGGAGAFDTWQAQTPGEGFHPINEAAAAVTAEERGRAPVEVPRRDPAGLLTSKTASTLLNANITPNEFTVELEEALARGDFSRMAYQDQQAVNRADTTVAEKGFQRAKEDWLAEVRSGRMSKDLTALGITLYNNAVNSGNTVEALDIAAEMVSYGKSVGQSLQAFHIIHKMTPSGQLYAMTKTAEHLDEQVKKRAKIDPETGLPDYKGIEIDPELARRFMEAETAEERAEIQQEIYRDIARQVPPTWKDKFDAWRYLAMLGNPRTHVRNILGNAGFAPVRMMKNAVAATLETATRTKGRTKALLNPASRADRQLLQAGFSDFQNVEPIIKGEGKMEDMENQIDQYRRIFRLPPLEGLRKANTALLDKEDMWFSQPAYAGALAGYLKANKISAADFMGDRLAPEVKAAAQEYAIREAQKATYRDTNHLSEFVSSASRLRRSENKASKVAGYLVEGVLPFKKTPANILMRGAEYSPAGLLKGLTYDLYQVKKGNKTAAEAIDGIASGLTGTGLAALGAFLAAQGLVSGGGTGDDKQDKFNDLQGEQNYALNIGDYSFTLDWLAPEALPFFVGVEFFQSIVDRDDGEPVTFQMALDALGRVADPMLEMSMLQPLNDLIDNVRYADNSMGALAANALTSYLSQFLPAIGGQIERTFEDTRQTTFIDKNSQIPASLQYLLGQWANKIPGVEFQQQDYLDAWGRPERTGDNILVRAFNNFLNPSYVSKRQSGAVEEELQRLYDAGFDGVLPSRLSRSTKLDGKHLSGEQYQQYAKNKGTASLEMLEGILSSPEYAALPDDEKAALVGKVYEFGGYSGKEAAGGDTEKFPRWYGSLIEGREKHGISPVQYLTMQMRKNAVNQDETMDNTQKGFTVAAMIDSNDSLTDEQKTYLKDKLKIYNMFPVDTGEKSKYQQAIAAGFTPEEAARDYKIIVEAKKYGEDGELDEAEFTRYLKEKMGVEKGSEEYNKYLKAYGNKNWKSVKALIGDQTEHGHRGYTMNDERYSSAVNAGFDEETSKTLSIGRQVADQEYGNSNGVPSKNELVSYIKANYPQDQWRSVYSVIANKGWKNPF